MKKAVLILAAMAIIIGLIVISGCSSSSTSSTPPQTYAPASSSAPSTTSASSAAVYNLKMADWDPPMAPICQTTQAWADMINKNTNGKVKITVYFGGTLLKTPEEFRGVQTGLADIGYYVIGTDPGLLPLNEVITLPFMGYNSRQQLNTIYGKLLEDPRIANEFQGVKVLGWNAMPGNQLNLTKKEVHTPADLKGLKLIVSGNLALYAQAAGAAPMNLGVGDWYSSLQKGLADGQFIHLPASLALKTLELFKYHTMFGDGGAGMGMDMFIINQKVWDSFTPDVQKVFTDAMTWRQQQMLQVDSGQIQAGMDFIKANNQVVYTPTADEMKLWQEAAKPIDDKWVSDLTAKGLPAQAVYDELQQFIQQTANVQ